MKKVYQKLGCWGWWIWRQRKWGIALVAAVLAGIMVFDPTVRLYVYEHTRWRSPLLPRPGEKFRFMDDENEYEYVFTTRFLYEDLSDYFSTLPVLEGLKLPIPRYAEISRRRIGRIKAIVAIEIVDYVEATMDEISTKPREKRSRFWPKRFTLAACKVNKVFAQRKNIVNIKEGDEIVILMVGSPRYINRSETPSPLLERGAQMIHCLISPEFMQAGFETMGITSFYANLNENRLYSPVTHGTYDFTGFEIFFCLPEYEKEYGPIGTWDVDTFSHNFQEYFDQTQYIS